MLLAHGAIKSIDSLDQKGNTPLMIAVQYFRLYQPGIDQIVQTLLEHGASINASTVAPCRTPLHYACLVMALADVRLLLEHSAGASVIDCVDYNGETALAMAVRYCSPDIVQVLLEQGARITAGTKCPFRFSLACPFHYPDECLKTVQLMLDHGIVSFLNHKDQDGNTQLHWVAQTVGLFVKVVQHLLGRVCIKPNPNASDLVSMSHN
eukprot:m.189355 g.189355  ORF g.189355 m.189355 type:complete len:208 (-) comp10033_c2_seq7:72-695(-)